MVLPQAVQVGRMEDICDIEILDRLRQASGAATDNELARRLGLSRQSIAKARATKSVPTVWIPKAAILFGVTTDWLFFGKMPMSSEGTEGCLPAHEPTAVAPCARCLRLEKKLDAAEEARWRLSEENRELLKENGALKLENLALAHQVTASKGVTPAPHQGNTDRNWK